MRILFLHGRLFSPDGDGGGGDAGAAAAAPVETAPTQTADLPPTPAEARQAESDDIMGGLPSGYRTDVPRGTSPEPTDAGAAGGSTDAGAGATGGADAGAGAAAGDTTDKGAGAAAGGGTGTVAPPTPPAAPAFDFTTIAGGKYKSPEEINTAITEAETLRTTMADPSVQALVNIAKDPAKATEFFREVSRDYVAEAKENPRAVLFEQYRADNPDFSDTTAPIRFKKWYDEQYPNLDINDPEDADYQESVALRDEDASIAAKKRTAVQQTRRDELLAASAKLATPAPEVTAAPMLTDAEIAAHTEAVGKALSAVGDKYAVQVDVLNAQGQKTGTESLEVPLATRDAVNLFMDNTADYFEQVGIIDKAGNMNYEALGQFALRAINHDAAVQSALQRGIALGVKQGAAAIINPADVNTNAPQLGAPTPAPGTPAATTPTPYQERQRVASENFPDF